MKYEDNRGYFLPIPLKITPEQWKYHGFGVVQANISYSKQGVIRGMHLQESPFEQEKQVVVLEGIINDVIIDAKTGVLNSYQLKEGDELIIPKGKLHGFEVISDIATILYFVNNKYNPKVEVSVNPLSIPYKWTTINPIMSEKDRNGISLESYLKKNKNNLK